MDFDLFEPDEDDDILSTLNIEPTQVPNDALSNDVIPEFQCQGEDSLNAQFSLDGFIKNTFLHYNFENKNKAIEEVSLSSYEFQKQQLKGNTVTSFVFGEACTNVQYLISSVQGPLGTSHEEISFYRRRRQVTLLYHLILQTTHTEEWNFLKPHLTRLRSLLNNCIQTETLKLVYFANSCKGNECNIPAYHLLHGLLEWKFLDLCILYKYDLNSVTDIENSAKSSSSVISQCERIVNDLLICSIFVYPKKRSAELLFSSPFPCTCVKEVWLLLQFSLQKWSLSEKPDEDKISFWSLFNKSMDRIRTKMGK
ncbi:MMS22-like protein [Lucilia cuprina]|uniref:MMS22-like protein n=1 Tax=Lucilia cuprina TaxID=7375 RepID=A0A0L0CF58_LUCCU|nr:MMS22-like protein [Lucilia cuprina]